MKVEYLYGHIKKYTQTFKLLDKPELQDKLTQLSDSELTGIFQGFPKFLPRDPQNNCDNCSGPLFNTLKIDGKTLKIMLVFIFSVILGYYKFHGISHCEITKNIPFFSFIIKSCGDPYLQLRDPPMGPDPHFGSQWNIQYIFYMTNYKPFNT